MFWHVVLWSIFTSLAAFGDFFSGKCDSCGVTQVTKNVIASAIVTAKKPNNTNNYAITQNV